MPSQSASAHIEAERRLRVGATTVVAAIWRSLAGYDRADVAGWLARVVPVIEAAQRQSIALTDAHIARALGRRPLGVDAGALIAGLRNGASTAEVYERPFVTVWTALGAGTAYEEAVSAGLARATGSAAMDVQMAMRGAANAVQEAGGAEFGYQRVADGDACEFCSAIDGAYVKSADAMALHNNCGCGLEPLTQPHPRAAKLPSGVAVHEHGELGAVLGDAAHDFTAL